MRIERLEAKLAQYGLGLPDLKALKQDVPDYTALVMQPAGRIETTSERSGNQDPTSVIPKYNNFLELALAENVDLAITPEYSCPWGVIKEIAADEAKLPEAQAVWIIGCESMTDDDLRDLPIHDHIEWVFDEKIFDQPGTFIDPVCIIFQSQHSNGGRKWIVLIQFKTEPMADRVNFTEKDNLKQGDLVYQLKNRGASSDHLLVFICSDALAITDEIVQGILTHSALVIHIQLNPKPRHSDFKLYRDQCFQRTGSQQTEVICINWSAELELNGSSSIVTEDWWGAGHYLKLSPEMINEQRINANHSRGLYAAYWEPRRTWVHYFNPLEAIFKIRSTTVSQANMLAAQSGRRGPEILSIWRRVNPRWEISNPLPEQDFVAFSSAHNLEIHNYHDQNGHLDVVNIERFIALSTGEINNKHWHQLINLKFFRADLQEKLIRITCELDQSVGAIRERNGYLENLQVLKNEILESPTTFFPETIKSLKDQSILKYEYGVNPNRNLYSLMDQQSATIAYLGEHSTTDLVAQIFDKMYMALEEHERLRLVVWYRSGGVLIPFCPEGKPLFDRDDSVSKQSITSIDKPQVTN